MIDSSDLGGFLYMSAKTSFLVASFVVASLGCSSADGTGTTPDDAGSDTRSEDVGGGDTHPVADTAPAADSGPAVCWFIKSGRSEERKCDDCSDVSCKTEREQCYGSTYMTGSYSGVCASYITCQCGCREGDDTCQQACKIEATRDCDECVAKISDCENTKCKPVCAPEL